MDLDNNVIRTFQERAEVYDKKMSWVNDHELIDPLITKPFGKKKALEICAGTGVISHYLELAGWNVTMLDASSEMLIRSSHKNYIVGDMHSLPFEGTTFDLVVCRQGLQYADLDLVFDEMIRVCDGEIRIAHITKEENDNTSFWEEYFMIASPGRKHIFSPGQLEKFAVNKGLDIVESKIITKQDYFIGPIIHLQPSMKNKLMDLLLSTTKEFKNDYNVCRVNDDIVYTNRWEFITLRK